MGLTTVAEGLRLISLLSVVAGARGVVFPASEGLRRISSFSVVAGARGVVFPASEGLRLISSTGNTTPRDERRWWIFGVGRADG